MGDTSNAGGSNGPFVSPGSGGSTTNNFLEVNTQNGTTYEVVDDDNCKLIAFTNAADITVTIPAGLTSGWHAMFAQLGTGQVIISPAGGVTVNEPDGNDRSAKQWAQMVLNYYAADSYLLGGYTA